MCLCTDMKEWAKKSAEKIMAQTQSRCPNLQEVKAMWCLADIIKNSHECIKEMSPVQRSMHSDGSGGTYGN